MKKLLILVMVLAMASLASATLSISVNGAINPPDTEINLQPSQHAVIDVTGDGLGEPVAPMEAWLLVQGPGTMTGGVNLYPGDLKAFRQDVNPSARWTLDYNWLTSIGYANLGGMAWMNFAAGSQTQPPLIGKLVDEIDFHCEGQGDVLITLVYLEDDGEGTVTPHVFDTQIIHQIPEPVTVALLGLGGLLLRRRIA